MWRILLIFFLSVCYRPALLAAPQERAELFAGYSAMYVRTSTTSNLQGWNASVAWAIRPRIEGVADFGGYYGSHNSRGNYDYRLHSFLFGPRLSTELAKVRLFTHLLAGAARESTQVAVRITNEQFQVGLQLLDFSSVGFALAAGAGLDLKATPRISVRLLQADWLYISSDSFQEPKNERPRISMGVVVRF